MADRWITFDNYGTLTNWLDGMRGALTDLGVGDKVEDLLVAYHDQELVVEGRGWRPYREVLEIGLERASAKVGVDLPENGTRALVDNWGNWPIYEDVEQGLGELRDAGWKLVVLTNCDDDLWAQTVEHLPIRLDGAITAEQVRSYKPELAHFRAFRDSIANNDLWVHAANSWLHDMVPARRSGVATVWDDRDLTGHPGDFPDRHIYDIKSLPATIVGLESELQPVSQSS